MSPGFKLLKDLKADPLILAGRLILRSENRQKLAEHSLDRENSLPSHTHLFNGNIQDRLGRVDLVIILLIDEPTLRCYGDYSSFSKIILIANSEMCAGSAETDRVKLEAGLEIEGRFGL